MKKLLLVVAVVTSACGGKKDEKNEDQAAKPAPGKAAEKKPAPPPAAPVDPATFVEIDLSSVPAIAGATAKAPPGAKLTPDRTFGSDPVQGAVIEQGDFALHLWRGTTGGERTVMPMKVEMEGGGKYTETTSEPSLVEYTIETNGTKTYGFFRPIDGLREGELNDMHAQFLCGNARPVATPEALAPYRAACDSVKKK